MADNKRLFFICTRQFWPSLSGGKDITLYYDCKGLCERYGYEIYLVCFSDKSTDKNLEAPDFIKEVKYVDVPNRIIALFNILGKSFLFKKWPFQNSLYYNKTIEEVILEYYQKIDPKVLIVDMVRLVPYGEKILKKFKVNKKILIEDDLLAKRYLRQIKTGGSSGVAGQYENSLPGVISRIINAKWIKNTILQAEIKRLEKYEEKLPELFDWITFVSPIETAEFNRKYQTNKAVTLTLGADIRYLAEVKSEMVVPNSLSIVGNFNTSANAQSLYDICNKVLPKLPNARLYVFGKCPEKIKSEIKNPNVLFKGFVDDLREEVTSTQVFFSPISFGTGIKTKIVEAMAMGMPVVTNSIGAEGLDVKDGREMFIKDNCSDMIKAVIELFNDETLRKEIGERGQKFVQKYHDWNTVYETFEKMDL